MDIASNGSTLWAGNGDTNLNNIDIPAAVIDTTVFMFPTVPIGLQDIGQVLVSPDQKFVVTADTDIEEISGDASPESSWGWLPSLVPPGNRSSWLPAPGFWLLLD